MRRPIHSVHDLGIEVRQARRAAGLDQATAAGLLGVGTRFLSELERGKATVRLDLVLQVLEGLGLELEIFSRGETR
jgi:y4mF family transcriptional regulator